MYRTVKPPPSILLNGWYLNGFFPKTWLSMFKVLFFSSSYSHKIYLGLPYLEKYTEHVQALCWVLKIKTLFLPYPLKYIKKVTLNIKRRYHGLWYLLFPIGSQLFIEYVIAAFFFYNIYCFCSSCYCVFIG